MSDLLKNLETLTNMYMVLNLLSHAYFVNSECLYRENDFK
ncbi:hypothetical protein THIOSC15_3320003 [uncultured Thiomicrorhabdus sp.]|jgi:hypothetical protein